MQELVMNCPCCGRPFVLLADVKTAAAQLSDEEMISLARKLGIEIGVEGGEEIGD